MNGQKAEDANVGMRLLVAGKATLTIGEKDLAISGSTSKKTSRNSCAPFSAGADGQLSIPFYNILWAEHANGTVTIDYTIKKSSSKLERKTQFFQTTPNDAAPAGQPDPETFVAAVMSRAYGRAMRQKRIYVLINPNSGPGNSVRMFENEARSIFEAARMKVDSVVLKKGGEATDIVEKVDIDKYDTIAAVSGDGTPYEIFNGLAKRPDARRALAKIAVSHIPGGSGNAKSNSWNGTNYAGPAALAIVKGIVTPLDLASITQGNTRTISLLSQAVGIMAEADLMTEDMRWLGNKRFDVGLLKRVFLKKCYPFDLAMKVELEGKDNIKAFYKRHRDTNGARAEWDRVTVDGYAEDDKSEGLPALRYGTINDELPQGWELVRYENIGNFFAGNLSLVTEKSSFWPAALPSDGCQDMITIEGTIPIHKAAQALMDTESPNFFDNPNVTYRKVSAYRIIPHDKTGVISVDGESIPWGPFQLETHRGLGRVLMRDGRFQHPGPKGWENAQI
ncbi:diacylglycerol kinase catalytic domain-containing protein [Sarocladium implicatum]|nr:diacylglycerol kinase catalytic domain-containing protein [Sarocladium implicatum]